MIPCGTHLAAEIRLAARAWPVRVRVVEGESAKLAIFRTAARRWPHRERLHSSWRFPGFRWLSATRFRRLRSSSNTSLRYPRSCCPISFWARTPSRIGSGAMRRTHARCFPYSAALQHARSAGTGAGVREAGPADAAAGRRHAQPAGCPHSPRNVAMKPNERPTRRRIRQQKRGPEPPFISFEQSALILARCIRAAARRCRAAAAGRYAGRDPRSSLSTARSSRPYGPARTAQ